MWQTEERTRRARRLRGTPTRAEDVFWAMVRGRGFEGLKFRRQAPVAGSICDFFCPELRLVVELDGGVHRLREMEDAARDAKLRAAGFTVIRSGNEAFLRNPNVLLTEIKSHAARMGWAAPSSDRLRRPPSPPRGEGS